MMQSLVDEVHLYNLEEKKRRKKRKHIIQGLEKKDVEKLDHDVLITPEELEQMNKEYEKIKEAFQYGYVSENELGEFFTGYLN